MADSAEVSQLAAAVAAAAQESPAPALSPGLEAALARLGSPRWGGSRPTLDLGGLALEELARLFCTVLPPYFAPAAALAEHPAAATSFARGLYFVASNCEPAEQRAAHALLDRLAAQADTAVAAAGPSRCVRFFFAKSVLQCFACVVAFQSMHKQCASARALAWYLVHD